MPDDRAPASRESLLAELDVYRPTDAREAAMVAEFTAFVRANPGCFERGLASGHVTASAWIVDATGAFALLTHHRKLGRWLQLGGHVDGDADVRRAALREAREESGLVALEFAARTIYDIDIHAIPARGGESAHTHYDVRFALIGDRSAPTIVSEESHELAWLAVASLDGPGIDDSVRRLARKTSSLRLHSDPR